MNTFRKLRVKMALAVSTLLKYSQPLKSLNLYYRPLASIRWRYESSNTSAEGKSDNSSETSPELVECMKAKEVLAEKVSELDDKYKRALAETENVRQRLQRQIEDAKLFGIQGFCKDLLEVADILQKATVSIPQDKINEQNPHFKMLFEGVRMTDSQLQKVFKKHGLFPIDPVGEKFNPNLHEALFEQPLEGKEPGTVAIVTKIGYKLHERTIRPALVGVVKSL